MSKMLLKSLLFAGLLTASASSVAQGYYEFIPYYGNDSFVFCTYGVPSDCWFPINPAMGTFGIVSHHCFNPVSAGQYARVCPHAFQSVSANLPASRRRHLESNAA